MLYWIVRILAWFLYVQFPKRMLKESELDDLKVSESDAHLEGMKRYSEFLSLHNKLLKSSSYARHVKGKRIASCFSSSLLIPPVMPLTVLLTYMLSFVNTHMFCSLSVFSFDTLCAPHTLSRFGATGSREGLQPRVQASICYC